MASIERLRADHADRLLAFERENREYFAASVPDRGDAYFAEFAQQLQARLAEQDAGVCRFHLVVDVDGAVLGRVNLLDLADGAAELGYRIAKRAAGRGLATEAVRQVCEVARTAYRLSGLWAVTTLDNAASRTVLARTGFEPTGELEVGGRPGIRYARQL
ncbi:MAG: GNAT family N-acetyltransferase [Micromonosporaceae bacterium]